MTTTQFEQIWQEYFPKVFGYFYRRLNCRQDIEDLTSITMGNFLAAIHKKGSNIKNQDAYLWRIANNQLVVFIRNKSKQPVLISLDENLYTPNEEEENYRSDAFKEGLMAIHSCIKKNLSSMDYKIVHDSIILDQKSKLIAEKLKLTSDTVRQRLSRALKKLRSSCLDIWKQYINSN